MALVGFDEVEVGIFDRAGEKITDLFVWRDRDGGTVNLNITGLEKEMVDAWASNGRVWMSKKGTGDVQSTFETFNPPQKDLDEVLGRDVEENTSWAGEDTDPPYVAMIAKSEDIDGEPVYMALVYGMFGQNEITMATRTNETTPPENTTLTGSWQNRTIDGKRRVFGKHIGSEGYEAFRKLVFPGAEEPEEVAP